MEDDPLLNPDEKKAESQEEADEEEDSYDDSESEEEKVDLEELNRVR